MDNSNEKLKLAEDLYNKVKFMSSPEAREMTLTLEQIFPELRESEYEKIRKAIQIYLDWLDGRKDYVPKGEYSISDMISWLNKQKPVKLNEEDEKTRKDLIEFVNQYGDKFYGTIAKASAISWLEKQKSIDILDEEEKEFADNVDSIRKEIDEAYQKGYNEGRRIENKDWLEKQGEQKSAELDYPYGENETVDKLMAIAECLEMDEDFMYNGYTGTECVKFLRDLARKQVECKPVDKVEPKFKVGDWVIDKQGIVHQIANVVKNVTYNTYGYDVVGGDYFNDSIEGVRLWTIKDAKDGDVLCSGNPFIFRGFGDKRHPNNPTAYCGIDSTDKFILSDRKSWWTANKVNPATKEQCELLFSKMKEAGYKWDAEKKELKKIEQNTAWSEEDKIISNEIQCLIGNYRTGDDEHKLCSWIDNLKDRVQPQSKQEWNEKDKANLGNIIWLCENCEKGIENTWIPSQAREIKELIKSLKPNRWKPSKEQIEAMEYAAAYVDSKEDKEVYRTIKSLLDELKILRDYE